MNATQPLSKFGFLGDLRAVQTRIAEEVGRAAATLHSLQSAAEAGEIASIPPAELARLLGDARAALLLVAS